MRDLSEIKKANEEFEKREKAGVYVEENEIDNSIVKRSTDVSGFPNEDRIDEVGQENRCKFCDEFPEDCECKRG